MLAAAAVATFAATPAVGQLGYALYTQWNDTTLPLADCKRRGERALRKAGFSDDFVTTSNSVYGRRKGGYTAAARCVTSKKFVFFAISGPKGDLSSKYLNEIAKNY
jgi:hypothetical protein